MLGHVRDSMVPLADAGERQPVTHFDTLVDRSPLPCGEWFHKRKFMINSNAKNLLSGSLADYAVRMSVIPAQAGIRRPTLGGKILPWVRLLSVDN